MRKTGLFFKITDAAAVSDQHKILLRHFARDDFIAKCRPACGQPVFGKGIVAEHVMRGLRCTGQRAAQHQSLLHAQFHKALADRLRRSAAHFGNAISRAQAGIA